MYRIPDQWGKYPTFVETKLLSEQTPQGSWDDTSISAVYVTAMNTTILQLNKGDLPIYQSKVSVGRAHLPFLRTVTDQSKADGFRVRSRLRVTRPPYGFSNTTTCCLGSLP